LTKASMLTIAALSAWPLAAGATPAKRIDLQWERRDPACLDADLLAATVEGALGRPVFHSEGRSSGTISGDIGKSGPQEYSARIVVRGQDGAIRSERRLRTRGDCARLDQAVAVVVALMVDDLEDAPATLSIPAEPPRVVAAPPPVVPRLPPSRPGTSVAMDLGAGVVAALLHTVTPDAVLRAEIDIPALVPISVTARLYGPTTSVVATGQGGRFDAWSTELALCPTYARPSVRLGFCGGIGAGAMTGTPVALFGGRTLVRPLLFAVVTPSIAVHFVGPLWLRAEAGALIPLLRDPWGFADGKGRFVEVERAGSVAPAASITVEMRTGS
jgi:hypothetical protein